VEWYLIRTNLGMEQWVREQMLKPVAEFFLPVMETNTRPWGNVIWCTNRYFPATFFACFRPHARRFQVKDSQRLRRMISVGIYPLTIPEPMMSAIKRRNLSSIIRLEESCFSGRERVRMLDGPFRGSWRSWSDACPDLCKSQICCIRSNRMAFACLWAIQH